MTGRIRGPLADAAPAVATALVILIHCGVARLLLEADEFRVYVAGHPIEWVCAVRRHFGVPCPTCGLTRSVVLALHGHALRAWRVAPGGAAAVVSGLLFVLGLLVLAGLRIARSSASEVFRARLSRGALVCVAIVLVVWIGGWAIEFVNSVHLR